MEMERGSRFASLPHNPQEDCPCMCRRRGITILPPAREEPWRARAGLPELYSSGSRSELVNKEPCPTYSNNKFIRTFNEIDRNGEFRLASNEVTNPDELIRSVSHRGHCRIYSPSHHCNAEHDVCYNHLAPMRDKATGKDLEITEDKKDNRFTSMWGDGMVLDGCGILLKKPIALEDGTVRPFFILPPESSDPLSNSKSYDPDNIIWGKKATPCAICNAGFGSTNSALFKTDGSYKLQCTRLSHGQDKPQFNRSRGEVFEKEEKDIFNYSTRAIYPFSFPQPIVPAVSGGPSCLHRGLSCDQRTNSLHARLEDISNSKLCEPTASEKHRQRDTYGKESSSVLHTGNCSSNDIQLYPTRQVHGSVVAACTENIRQDSFHAIPMPYDNCPQRQESWQCGSVKPHLDVQINDHMENTANLRKHFTGEKENMSVQNDPLDDHGYIHRSFSPRAISSGLNGDLFGSRRSGLPSSFSRTEVSRSPPIRHAREEYSFGENDFVMDSKQAAKNCFPEAAVNLHKSSLSPSSRSKLSSVGLDEHGYEKPALKRKHIMEDNHRGGLQQRPSNDQGKSRKLRKLDPYENGWVDQEGTSRSSIHSWRSFNDKAVHRNSDTISMSVNKSSDMQRNFSKSRPQSKFSGSLNQTKINCHREDKSDYRNDEQDLHHPYNSQKHRSECLKQDSLRNKCCEENDLVDDRDPVQLPDLPEDSEKFKQKVQNAFLRFVKILNENPGERKRYEENGRYESLLCIVCRSLSKPFGTTHSLVAHAFNSQKVGLRAEHLGLHKALCVIMGWNYAVVPDNKYVYQSLGKPDAIAMKEDLILWPPLVIIHTYTSKTKQDGCQVVTSNTEMDDILRGLGFGSGKSKAVDSTSASQGTFIVKFIPTYSGLQEAQRLHKNCEENCRGRNNWVQLQSLLKSQHRVGKSCHQLQDERPTEKGKIFYGYIGIAGDLDKVDFDTRKRSLVKSRKDIEAIADGPVLGA